MKVDVSKWLRDNMEAKEMTQADVARASGLSTAVVAQIATGKTKNPTLSKTVSLAMALNTSLDSLEYYIVDIEDDF